jgi:hypothetical protein
VIKLLQRIRDGYNVRNIKKALESPKRSYEAGKFWSFKKFTKHAEELAKTVAQNKHFSLTILQDGHWKENRLMYGNTANILVQGLKGDPNYCRKIGVFLKNDTVFDKISDSLTDILLEEDFEPWLSGRSLGENHLARSVLHWKPERAAILRKKVISKYNLAADAFDYYDSLSTWDKHFVEKLVPIASFDKVNNFTEVEFALLSEAHQYALLNDTVPQFLIGFSQVAKSGNVKMWAETILNHYKADAFGGDKYDRKVIAA